MEEHLRIKSEPFLQVCAGDDGRIYLTAAGEEAQLYFYALGMKVQSEKTNERYRKPQLPDIIILICLV
ncbi:hypothetical protein [[Clostridium] hylemonae]|uniref:Uncharacterized protein n=1 Tax=[Clostridium] hylemonae DSM 15053 TaxID=553973 RepID=C0BZD8_9FIRM|nr:hypothetical protein [[Clostridium] hylemonae]EEG74516.1 hypothetical protein CLOHYLEM_05178 [[Clostridium] hylemonae DSM 15053]